VIIPYEIEGELRSDLPTVVFTGHRKGTPTHESTIRHFFRTIHASLPLSTIVVGGALWFDTIIAEEAACSPHTCHLVLARPFVGHDDRWPSVARDRFRATWEAAQVRVTVCDSGSHGAYHIRNSWMLDRAVEAVDRNGPGNGYVSSWWDGREHGGTRACIREAHRRGLSVGNWFPRMPPRVGPDLPAALVLFRARLLRRRQILLNGGD